MPEIRMAQGTICDFCSDVEPRYLEDCETFETYVGPDMGMPTAYVGRAEGAWSACVACHEMIKARKWRNLQRRAVEAMLLKYPSMPKNRVQRGVEIIHGAFRAHKPVDTLNP